MLALIRVDIGKSFRRALFASQKKETLSIEEVRSVANQVTEWLKVSVD